jgi:D-aminopeptidase
MADPMAAAIDLLGHLVDAPSKSGAGGSSTPWDGDYLDPEAGIVVRLRATADHRLRMHYAQSPELLDLGRDDEARSNGTALRRGPDGIRMERAGENHAVLLEKLAKPADVSPDIEGSFVCAELDATFTCTMAGGAPYGGFSGFLGHGPMQSMIPAGPDVWRLPMPRALDHSPPGDWTIRFQRDAGGRIARAMVGCWLARNLEFVRV